MKVYAKLIKIQAELKAPKNQYNSFGKYSYRSCEDILEAVKPLASKYGCALIIGDEIVNIGDRFYVKATATLIDSESGDYVNNTAYAREDLDKKGMDGSQLTGATSSYARKYCLNGLFAIDDTKDADTNEYTERTKNTAPKKPQLPKQDETKLKRMFAVAHEAGYTENMLHTFSEKAFGKKSLKELTNEEIDTIIKRIEVKAKK